MNVKNREGLVRFLKDAKGKGALKSVDDVSYRDIRIEAAGGAKFKISWYRQLCALKSPGFSMWFDGVELENSHPSFDVALSFYCNGKLNIHIGKVCEHSADSFEV